VSAYSFRRLPGESAVEAWRPLDRALYRWVIGHGGDTVLAATAAWASFADGNGDAALPLDESRYGMPVPTPAQLAQLRASPLVATAAGQGVRPFALDDGRFYLWRNHAHEVAAARRVGERRSADAPAGFAAAHAQADRFDAELDALFHGERGTAVGPQREAVRRVAGRRLFVLTGGPGTGKTTTVLRMLLMLQRRAASPLSILIAAPTGKAAQRLVQALRHGKSALREHPHSPLPVDWWPLLDAIPDGEATTVHRLLGYQPWRNAFRRNARDPIAADVVVVDEASMIDLAMLRSLLDAVRPQAALILVGDADQLTSVATGSVLRDLVAALQADPRGDLVRLTHSFRAERELVAVNEAVRAGASDALDVALAASNGRAVLRRVEDERALREQIARWARELAAVSALRPVLPAAPGERAELVRGALAALAERQILCALRETPFGAVALNALLEANLRRLWNVDAQAQWYPGRAVIVTRNDYSAGLFNGDVGLCLMDAAGDLRVWFEGTADQAGGGLRGFAPHGLPAHEAAFAITIHKSQGSEYRHAAVLLPPDAEHRILSRQLLYTGVSRAKQSIEIWTAPAALQAALATEVHRAGGLRERLAATR
jgi:exodeoxyribonuclease V alpha subunit